MMKEYNKLIREINKMSAFELIKTSGTKATVKLRHIASGEIYSIHPGDNAVKPLKKWMQNQEKI